jgi:hypothetical protein
LWLVKPLPLPWVLFLGLLLGVLPLAVLLTQVFLQGPWLGFLLFVLWLVGLLLWLVRLVLWLLRSSLLPPPLLLLRVPPVANGGALLGLLGVSPAARRVTKSLFVLLLLLLLLLALLPFALVLLLLPGSGPELLLLALLLLLLVLVLVLPCPPLGAGLRSLAGLGLVPV